MSVIRKGLYLELRNVSTSRIIFSAATDELEKKTFDELWRVIGDNIFNAQEPQRAAYYEIRVSPLT